MALISKKKIPYKVSPALREYLQHTGREVAVMKYNDLLRYTSSIALMDRNGVDTLWETVIYPQNEANEIHDHLKEIYTRLLAHGDMSVIEHLYIDRIDICPFGNSKPFRVRIVNKMNDNFDYFYVKVADASRIYGLELEHLLSPNRINYLVFDQTLIEEHIAGVPGDMFIKQYINDDELFKIRVAKEFVKFTERCLIRLLGDMHSSNFVMDITPDFEDIHYRIRAIDFDQQSYEGRLKVYMPQHFAQNSGYVKLGMEVMTVESKYQYQLEERSLIKNRIENSEQYLKQLIEAMTNDRISSDQSVENLKKEISAHFKNDAFLKCKTMGEIVKLNLEMLWN